MSIFGQHINDTIGSDASDTAREETLAFFNEAITLLADRFDTTAGDSVFTARNLARNFRDSVLHGGEPAYSNNGSQKQAAGELPSGNTDTTAEASEETALGQDLLKIHGNSVDSARKTVGFLKDAFAKDSRILTMMSQVLYALTRDQNPDHIVEENHQLMLGSERNLRNRFAELESAFQIMATDLFGAIPAGTVRETLNDARREIKDLKSKTPADDKSFRKVLEDASKVSANKGETLEEYVARVVDTLNKGAGIDRGTSLDKIGKALRIDRKKLNDDEYQDAIIKAAESAMKTWDIYDGDLKRVCEIAQTNSVSTQNVALSTIVEGLVKKTQSGKMGLGVKLTLPEDNN
jgi:hypothetical protein